MKYIFQAKKTKTVWLDKQSFYKDEKFIIFIVNMNLFKTFVWISIISVLSVSSTLAFDFKTDCQEKTFIVTAYYSPKVNQKFYYKDWFQPEVILNGSGTHWASGKPVFNWMLAAPSTYAFWWKIFFPSLWVWEIADRWWAIVHAWERKHNHDRIDIWMWEGEEWLIRALTFWKRTIVWYYCNNDTLKQLWAKPKVGLNFEAIPVLKYFFDSALFIQELVQWRTDVRVYKLQEYLIKFGYMDKKTWHFWPETKKALCSYQIKRWITSKKYCGTFGSSTRYYMKNDAKKKWFLPDFWLTTSFDELISFAWNYNWEKLEKPISDNKTQTKDYFTQSYKKNEQNDKISALQDMLRHYWFYKWELNRTYDVETINSVHHFQVTLGILKANDYKNPARWWMGPSTRKALNQKWNEFQEWKNLPHPTSL